MKGSLRCLVLAALSFFSTGAMAQLSFSDFCDVSAFTLNGITGSITPNGDCALRLTNDLGQSGSAFITTPITLTSDASFSSAFSFQFTNQKGGGADGLVFVVQTVANDVGGGGGGIGYNGIGNSVGIEFDNWFNGGSDPNDSHMGIDLNGSVNSVLTSNTTPNLDDGDIWYAWVDYNGLADELEVRLSTDATRPADPDLTYSVDLTAVLGQTDAFVGFTSGTGAASAFHDVLSWQFRGSYDPIDEDAPTVTYRPIPVPALSKLGLILMGCLTLLVAFRRFTG